MFLKFWNLNNNKYAFDLALNDILSSRHPMVLGISEYWDINKMLTQGDRVLLDHNGRTGILLTSSVICYSMKFTKYYSKYILQISNLRICIYVVHLMSMIRSDVDADRINCYTCQEIISDNKGITIPYAIMGDFNTAHGHDLFENAFNFNTVNYFDGEDDKVIDDKKFTKLYSPLGSLFNNYNKANGSYFYNKRTQSQSWHLIDQILLSPSLAKLVVSNKTGIQIEIFDQPLIKGNGRIRNEISDHLPIQVYIDSSQTLNKEHEDA